MIREVHVLGVEVMKASYMCFSHLSFLIIQILHVCENTCVKSTRKWLVNISHSTHIRVVHLETLAVVVESYISRKENIWMVKTA